jgi:hypothetical protein
MESHDTLLRRSRMSRSATNKRIGLTDRDLDIFGLLHHYRYLRSTHLHALAGGKSHKRFIERLGDLYHEGGYVNRPPQQWQAINARYTPAVYELGDAGERALKQHGLLDDAESPRLRKGRPGEVRQYHHELMICDIMSSIEIGVRANPTLRFISSRDILAKAPEATRQSATPFAVPVFVSHAMGDKLHASDKPLIPDALFGIEYATEGQRSYRFFALEADRNSEPVVRANLHQTSYLRKILQYREIAARATYKAHWGLPNLLVLTVTTSEQHMKNMMRLVDELTDGKGSTSLHFKTMQSLASLETSPLPSPSMLTEPWHRAGHVPFRIDAV